MRITVKPPSPPNPPLPDGALVALRVEAADPAPLLSGPPSITYEGRYDGTAFLFPVPANDTPALSTAPPAASDFRTPFAAPLQPHVDVPLGPGDVVTATLTTPTKTYSASYRQGPDPAPAALTLVEGGAAPPTPPTPQPAPGLTITPHDGEGDVLTLDPAPGNDNIVVVN